MERLESRREVRLAQIASKKGRSGAPRAPDLFLEYLKRQPPKDPATLLTRSALALLRGGFLARGVFRNLEAGRFSAVFSLVSVAEIICGEVGLPSVDEMRAQIAAYDEALRKRYVASKRHTIQVDAHTYLTEIRKERQAQRV